MTRALIAAGLVSAMVAAPAAARAPSFSCAGTLRADERAICRSPALSAQDARLAALFSDVTGCLMMGGRDVERTMQWRWLQQRARCRANTACLGRLYRARIAAYAPRAAKARRLLPRGDCPAPI